MFTGIPVVGMLTRFLTVEFCVLSPETQRERQREREREREREGKDYSLNPKNPTYFSWGSHRIQGRVHLCAFNLIGVERLRHHSLKSPHFTRRRGEWEGGSSRRG